MTRECTKSISDKAVLFISRQLIDTYGGEIKERKTGRKEKRKWKR